MPTTTPLAPVADALHTGRYDCGHVLRSNDGALRRALCLHLAESDGVTLPPATPEGESPEVVAALTLMRRGATCAEVVAWRTYTGQDAIAVPVAGAPTPRPERLTPEMREALRHLLTGASIPEVADLCSVGTEAIRTRLAGARRMMAAHSSHAAAVAAYVAGVL